MQPTYQTPELNSFDAQTRRAALERYAAHALQRRSPDAADRIANMHCHSFFSYNALNLSPSALAVMAREEGIDLLGIVDFDVIDGVDEFLDACERLAIRGGASIETRIYLPEFSAREVNSPGEPGVLYHMGTGFATSRVPPAAAPYMTDLTRRARKRNEALVARANAHLDPVGIDYERDVLPLTPSGNATERHIVMAFIAAADARFDDPAPFWRQRLDVSAAELDAAAAKPFGLPDLIRKRLVKRGGAAYVQPGPDTFPRVEEFHALVTGCSALPCAAWLDGTSAGEQAMPELLSLLVEKGVAAFNIVPDRNWNIADPAVKQIKLQNLYAVVELATAHDLPILVGTEMNSPGQPLADNFAAPELQPVRAAFIDGAHFLYGHTMLARHAGLGATGEWVMEHLPSQAARNAFYTQVGRQLPPGERGIAIAKGLTPDLTPDAILAQL